ncbi:MAG TPA: ABC transporter ATP-binding protein, partial [Dialister sp.]|nr:ABC transporter ATP-binding protein [Dialister sp.]
MLLEIKDLGIAYGKAEPVVRHVSFTLDQGE